MQRRLFGSERVRDGTGDPVRAERHGYRRTGDDAPGDEHHGKVDDEGSSTAARRCLSGEIERHRAIA
jgi:hypothetical protein